MYTPQLNMVLCISRVTRPHGNNGVVKAKFASNIPPHAFGASVRVVRTIESPFANIKLTCTLDVVPLYDLIYCVLSLVSGISLRLRTAI